MITTSYGSFASQKDEQIFLLRREVERLRHEAKAQRNKDAAHAEKLMCRIYPRRVRRANRNV